MPVTLVGCLGVIVVSTETMRDDRGFFRETFRLGELEAVAGRPLVFVQENHSRSRRGVLRGLHFEDWDKLVYVPNGEVLTAVADVRPDSPTFGRAETFPLGEANLSTLFIPRGLAHGFCVLSEAADYVYQTSAYWEGKPTPTVAWNDADLAIPWPIHSPSLSPNDQNAPTLRQLFAPGKGP